MYWLLGAQGMLGRYVRSRLERENRRFLATDAELDITDARALFNFAAPHPLQVVINCAAFTDVRACEYRTEEAFSVNGDGVRNLARVCAWKEAHLVHVSTDYVFDGSQKTPYGEDATTRPLNSYGRSKLAGERYLRAARCRWTLVRTAWLYGEGGRNFVTTVLEKLNKEGTMRVVNDQFGSPTFAGDLAEALLALLKAQPGIYHFANTGLCSWYEFACEIVQVGAELGLVPPGAQIRPISSSQLKDPVVRPAYSALATEKISDALGRDPRPWQEALREFLSQRKKTPVG